MNIIEIIAQDIFDKVRGRFSNLEMGNEEGSVTSNPKEARFFDFDFMIEEQNLGRVSISINERGSLKIFYSQGITEGVDSVSTSVWYDFLKEMRYFAKRRMLVFDTRDITKGNLNKNDFQYLAQNGSKEENMNESKMYGTPTRSYKTLENKKKKFKTRMVIRHSEAVDESVPGARSRKIDSIFIENHLGERYKMPINSLKTAGAMLRHVANEGLPYDNVGKKIIEMGTQMAELASFRRHASLHDSMNTEANEILERCNAKFMEIRSTLEGLSKPNYYEAWVENFEPSMEEGFDLDEATLEDYKAKFTVNRFEENLAQYFPLVHKIMQETGTIDLEAVVSEDDVTEDYNDQTDESKIGFDAFESWAESVVEGTLNPDTLGQLIELLQTGLTFGGNDAFGAIEALENIGMSNHRDWDKLEAALRGAAGANPDGDPKDVIVPWLQKDDPEAAAEIQRMTEPQQAEPVEPPVAEGPADEPVHPDDDADDKRWDDMDESEGRMEIGQQMANDGVTYSPEKEKELIGLMSQYMKKAGMSSKQIRYLLSYDQDYIPDQLSFLPKTEDSMDNAEGQPRHASTREIAETVMSFFNKENMTFPKGEEGVIIRCGKMYGPRGEQLAERLIDHIKQQREAMEAQRSAAMQFEEIRRLAGLVK